MPQKKITKSKKELALEARNKAFKKLSPSKKRIAIAQDVIQSLKIGKFKAKPGVYCSIPLDKAFKNKFEKEETELQPLLFEENPQNCKVCAMGSLFLSRVSLGNQYKVGKDESNNERSVYVGDTEIIESLDGIFSLEQLRLMEYAFEDRNVIFGYYHAANENAKIFYRKHRNPAKRMVAIMENVIENKGIFKL